MKTACLTMVLSLFFVVQGLQAADNLKAFGPAQEGMVRYVLQLEAQDEESAFRVELVN